MSQMIFEELFHKFLDDTITVEELARFKELFNDERNHILRDRLLEEAFSNKTYLETKDYDPAVVYAELLSKIKQQQVPNRYGTPVVPLSDYSPSRRLWSSRFRYIAAAIFIVLVLAGAAYYFENPGRHPSPSITAKPMGAPGGNKAFLTLADGSIVTLDTLQTGTLVKQGNSRVVKMDSGLLAYNAQAGQSGEPVYNVITTPRGGQYQILLPDGTRVWLNSASSLRFPISFSGKERAVTITGEGYFEVAKDPSMPFVVDVGAMKVTVLGTRFNIMAYADEASIKTSLAEGSVRINSGNNGILLKPGQQAQLPVTGNNSLGGRIRIVEDADMEEVLAWKEGRFQFNESDIESIMRQVGRWYDLDIVYKGDLSGVGLSGSISRKEYVTQLLELLEATKRVRFVTEGGKIIVMPYRQ